MSENGYGKRTSSFEYRITGRGGKGRELLQRGQFTRVLWPTPDAPYESMYLSTKALSNRLMQRRLGAV